MLSRAVDLRRAASRVASSRTVSRWAGNPEDNLGELGMHAEFGQDEDMTSTHTLLEQEDLESVDTRPEPGNACPHERALPGDEVCPDCGAAVEPVPRA